MTLDVTVKKRIATYISGQDIPVCGNTGDQVKFTFDEEWSQHETKTARFKWGGKVFDQEFTGNICEIPSIDNADSITVGVFVGEEENGEDELSTTDTKIPYNRSTRCGKNVPHSDSGESYTNLAKGYAESAKASETSAKASETSSAESATTATEQAEIATEQATNASASSASATESATQAKGYMEVTQGIAADYENIDARISRNSKCISNLEKGITPSPFVTDNTVDRVKVVPENALSYALLQKVGGMSYAGDFSGLRSAAVTKVRSIGKNLLTFGTGSATQAGVTYTKQADGGIAVKGTPTGSSSHTLNTIRVSGLAGFWIMSYGDFSNVVTRCNLKSADGKSPLAKDVRRTPFYVDLSKYPTAVEAQIQIARDDTGVATSGTIYPMISLGSPTEYEQYKELTHFDIPADVQALEGYGMGVNTDYNNHISWDEDGTPKWNLMVKRVVLTGTEKWTQQGDNPFYAGTLDTTAKAGDTLVCSHYESASIGNSTTAIGAYFVSSTSLRVRPDTTEIPTVDAWKTYLQEQYAAGTPVTVDYAITKPEVTDISDLITPDNIIEVAGGGTLWFENSHNLAPASTATYQTKEEAV